jgi:acyl-CoA hydrolase
MAETQRRDVTLRFLAQPADVNFGGKVHGGSVMRWIDQAGCVPQTQPEVAEQEYPLTLMEIRKDIEGETNRI